MTRGERFKDARVVYNQHGRQTMAQVHKATGVSASLIQELEDDSNRDFGYIKIAKLADHYGVSIDWLLGLSPTRAIDPGVQGICKYTGLSEASVDYLYDKRAANDYRLAHIIDSILFSSECTIMDSTLVELLGELLCTGRGVDDSILGVLLDIAEAQKRYKQRNNRVSNEKRNEVEGAEAILAAHGLLAITPDVAYRHSIEMAVGAFRKLITSLVERE